MQQPPPTCWAVIPAAGQGRRLGSPVPKQHLEIDGRSLLQHSLDVLLRHPDVRGAVLALAPADPHWQTIGELHGKPVLDAVGGTERSDSVLSGLRRLSAYADSNDWVLVHDAARPCLSDSDLNNLISTLRNDPVGGILAAPARDTLKRAENGRITCTVTRTGLWHAMTPQMFRYGLLLDCLQLACTTATPITDEASALEHAGYQPRLVEGSWENFKVTLPEDLRLAEVVLTRQRPERAE